MVNKTSTPQLIVKPLQFVEEAVEGTIPATGTVLAVGVTATISVKKDGQWVEVPQLGSEDLADLVQGRQKYPVQIKYSPIDSNFLKYGVNSANYGTPAGTISKSLSLIVSAYFNGVENFIIFSGVRPNQVQYDRDIGKPDVVTMDVVCMSIAAPSITAPTGLTLVTALPVGPVFSWLSGGASPISDGATGQDCKKFSITIGRNTKEDYTIGSNAPFGTQPHGRRIAFSADLLWDAKSTAEADQAAGTKTTIACVLKTAGSTLTLSNAVKTNYNRDEDITSDMAVVESITGKAETVTVT